ncbi:MAG: hypothetical protein R3D85_04735 [Paracoccaceae bacterium]
MQDTGNETAGGQEPNGQHDDMDDIRARAEEVVALIKAGRPAEALSVAKAMQRNWPDALASALSLFRAHLALDDADSAEVALAGAVPQDGAIPQVRMILHSKMHLAKHKEDDASMLEHALTAAELPNGLPEQYALLAVEACARLGRVAEYDRLSSYLGAQRRSRRGARAAYERAISGADDRPPAEILREFVLGEDAVPENIFAVQLHLNVIGHDPALVDTLVRGAIERWPDDPAVAEMTAKLRVQREPSGPADNAIAPEDVRKLLAARNWRSFDGAALLRSFDADLRDWPLGRAIARDLTDEEVLESPVEDGAPTAIVFPGLGDMNGGSLELFDTYLAMAGYNAIYVRDHTRRVGACGITALGQDLESTLAALQDRLNRRNAGAPLVIGASAGGLAALNYGQALGAERIILFASPSNVTPEFMESIGDNRAKIGQRRLFQGASDAYLRALPLREAGSAAPKVDAFFDPLSRLDAAHARELGGCPTVTLHHVHANGRHVVWSHLMIERKFLAAIGADRSAVSVA